MRYEVRNTYHVPLTTIMNIIDQIKQTLHQTFHIHHLELIDESFKHAGHAEAKRSGGGHFQLFIVSPDFTGKTLVQRHRMVNEALKDEFKSRIHALSIRAFTPEET